MAGMQIEGRVAFVTGGASGIGLAIARSLVRARASVAIADMNEAWLELAVAELGDQAMALPLDVTDRAGWSGARAAVESRLGPVDILVNNAGIGPSFDRLDEMAYDTFDRMVAIKLGGTFAGIHEFVPGMRERRRGHVVNTTSMAGISAKPRLGAYTSAMFGVVGMSEVLAAELAEDGIGVTILCPGRVATRIEETSTIAGVRRSPTFTVPTGAAFPTQKVDPAVVGELTLDAIRGNHLYVATHASRLAEAEGRMEPIREGFARAPGNH